MHVLHEAAFDVLPSFVFDAGTRLDDPREVELRAKYLGPSGRIRGFQFGCVLLQIGGRNVLLDTALGCVGVPPYIPGGRTRFSLLRTLRTQVGVSPEEVDIVIHSHLHGDHVGWNVRPEPLWRALLRFPLGRPRRLVPTFPNAVHVVQRREWEYAQDPRSPWHAVWEMKLASLEARGMVRLVEGSAEVCPGVEVLLFRGHTPGHQCVRVKSGGEVAYYVGDALHLPAQAGRPDWSPKFDTCCFGAEARKKSWTPELRADPSWGPSLSSTNRQALLELICAESALLLSPHFPAPGAGRLTKRGLAAVRYEYMTLAEP